MIRRALLPAATMGVARRVSARRPVRVGGVDVVAVT